MQEVTPTLVQSKHDIHNKMDRKKARSETRYTLHKQTLERAADAKYFSASLTETLPWGKQVTATAAKANRVNAFVYKNQNGCPTAV